MAVLTTALVLPLLGSAALAIWPEASPTDRPLPPADLEAESGYELQLAAAAPLPLEAIETELAPMQPVVQAALPQVLTVSRGDTLAALLNQAGIEPSEAHQAITALKAVYSPRRLQIGQQIRLTLAPEGDPNGRLLSLSLQPSVEQEVQVARAETGRFEARAIDRPLSRELTISSGIITSSLFEAGNDAEVPMRVLLDLIRTYSFDVDFQRDIQPSDSFEVLYEQFADEDGEIVKTGEMLYASLTLSQEEIALYRYTPKSGVTDYFDSKGQSVRKTLMRTPIDGARLSSGYGMRHHPVLGYTKMHRGIDFAAPTGTPIYAAGDGVVERAGRFGAYGNYIRLRHTNSYGTAYAHLKGYAKGIKAGARVKQGQVIGYVGTTGRSTGPHLHYEVLVSGKRVNPTSLKLPSGENLKGKELRAFKAAIAEVDALRARLNPTLMVRGDCVVEQGSADPDARPAPGC